MDPPHLFHLSCDGRCFESDGEFAIGGSSTGKLLFWKLDEPTGRELVFQISNAHPQAVSSIAVSTNGSTLVSASVDGSIRIWRLKRKTTATRGRLPGFFN
jgi:WD40 repeat protein